MLVIRDILKSNQIARDSRYFKPFPKLIIESQFWTFELLFDAFPAMNESGQGPPFWGGYIVNMDAMSSFVTFTFHATCIKCLARTDQQTYIFIS